jgi:glucosamine kinase
MSFYIGVDGGGTKTVCLVGDEFSVLGRATAGGSNVVRVGEEAARAALEDALRNACRAAKIESSAVRRSCVGLAGAGRESVRDFVARVVREIVAGEIYIVGDMEIAMEAAFGSGPGVIVIAGTGSIAFGRNERGETARVGGWGWAVSDEGSAQWIGREAVAAVFRAHDRGQHTRLASAIRESWKLASHDELVRLANSVPPPDFAMLAAIVARCADEGDPAAADVLNRAGAELAKLAEIVIERLWPDGGGQSVAMVGSVVTHIPAVRLSFSETLTVKVPQSKLVEEMIEPAEGALSLARRGAHAQKA